LVRALRQLAFSSFIMDTTQKYLDALGSMEDSLLSSVVPGELVGWMAALSESAEFVGALLWRHYETVHDAQYSQIVKEDSELLPRVERMKRGDAESLERLEGLLDRIDTLKRGAPQCEPDETALITSLNILIDQGLAWLIHAKRQERARETWLVEAFNRDRGILD
jgi:hypothetical protein